MPFQKPWSSGPRYIVLSRTEIQPLQYNDYFADTNIPRHGRVPCRNTIHEWVQNFRENASALRRNPRGRIPTVRTPENADKVRMAIVKSPRRSVRRHSAAIGLSDRSVWRILHKNLHFHPYKTAIFSRIK